MQQLADTRSALHITHHYAASPARVFDAWLTPQVAGLWLFATASRPMVNVVIDARAGGAFCFVERRAGAVIEHRGQYIEIASPQRLVFMLRSPDCAPKEVLLGGAARCAASPLGVKEAPLGGASHATRVTAKFTTCGTGCELRLAHDGLSAEGAARMEARWTGMLYGLGVVLAQPHPGEIL